MNRRNFVKFIYLASGIVVPSIALYQSYINQVEAGIPVLPLIIGTIEFLTLVKNSIDVGKEVAALIGIGNPEPKPQSGAIIINVFNSSNPSTPEVTIRKNLTIPPRTQQTYQLPSIQPSSPGKKILQVTTGLNSLSTTFRYGSFCCDSRGNRRCPVPYSLDLGTECLCSGQGVGIICE